MKATIGYYKVTITTKDDDKRHIQRKCQKLFNKAAKDENDEAEKGQRDGSS